MKPNNRITYDQQNQSLARMREDAVAMGHLDGLFWNDKGVFPSTVDIPHLVTGMEIPLTHKYLNNMPFKFGGNKKKASNSGGCGKAGRRKKNPRFPSNIR